MDEPPFDWNDPPPALRTPSPWSVRFGQPSARVRVVDETLRDGMQNATGFDPPLATKIELLHAMARVGVDVVSVGLPAAGGHHAEDTVALVREIASAKLPLVPTAAGRTVVADVAAVARVADRAGLAPEVYAFIGSSPIRHSVEGWDVGFMVRVITDAAKAAQRWGLRFTLVTEDTTRSRPDALRSIYRAAVDAGALRICLCDTAGHATTRGVEQLVTFVQGELATMGAGHVGLDWHGHNDRGLGLSNALWAAALGVERIHGTGLGVGERVGNPPLELLIDNLVRLGVRPPVPDADLLGFCQIAARALHWAIPVDHPIAGRHRREPELAPSSAAGAEPRAAAELAG
jgi:2-isopropylmalate synthase